MSEEKQTANRWRSRSAVQVQGAWRHPQKHDEFAISAAGSNIDPHLERYFLRLKGWVAPDCRPLTLAREQYALFQEMGAAQYRHQAWAHIQRAAAEARQGRRGKAVAS